MHNRSGDAGHMNPHAMIGDHMIALPRHFLPGPAYLPAPPLTMPGTYTCYPAAPSAYSSAGLPQQAIAYDPSPHQHPYYPAYNPGYQPYMPPNPNLNPYMPHFQPQPPPPPHPNPNPALGPAPWAGFAPTSGDAANNGAGNGDCSGSSSAGSAPPLVYRHMPLQFP